MATKRRIIDIQSPQPHQGFLGSDHTARALIQKDFSQTDPFILLMDDRLDKQGGAPVGGPHPHAGFETVSLLLEGEMGDAVHQMKEGDFQLMTAGSGVIHTETIDRKTRMWLLQLWLNLPKKDRWAVPRVQDLPLEHVPTVVGFKIRVYSGSLAGVSSPIQNYVPLIIADIQLKPGITTIQQIPASYTAFLYAIEGSVQVGEESTTLALNQVGWLDQSAGPAESELQITAGAAGGRVILYAGQPQGDRIVSHGPFIGDNQEDIVELYKEYRQGKMQHISGVAETQKIRW
jgi:quercetin 2,3-dioxygenase